MEDGYIKFFVSYKNHQAVITLSENDTVEHLKIEIFYNFGIPIMDQVISGWHKTPENNKTILQSCYEPNGVNWLVVSGAPGHNDEYLNEERVNNKTNDTNMDVSDAETEICCPETEIAAVQCFKEKFPNIPFEVQSLTFQDAVFSIMSSSQKKVLLLYLHNSQDIFSHNFLGYSHDDDVTEILKENFFIIGWDIEDSSYHGALISALRPFEDLTNIAYLIKRRIGAAICCLIDKANPVIFSYLRGDMSYENILESLINAQVQLRLSELVHENTDSEEGYFLKEQEIEAIKSFQEKLPSTPLKVQHLTVREALDNINCEKKALLLYLHNSQDIFSHNFLSYVYDVEVANILEHNFLIIAWNIEDCSHGRRKALIRSIEQFGSLSFISKLISDKACAAVCLLRDGNEPFIFSCLRNDLSYQDVLQRLVNLQEQLNISETHDSDYPMEGCSTGNTSASDDDTSEQLLSEVEMEAIESLRRKVPPTSCVTFRCCTLDDAIDFICTSPFDERKVLLLYFHNSEDPFSKMFSESLRRREMFEILNRSFLVLGWDVEEPKFHKALANALSRHINLSEVANLLTNKISVGLCILPVGGVISLSLCLRGKITLKDTIKSLREVEKGFKEIIDVERELKQLESNKSNENDLGSEKLHSIWADMLGDRDYDSLEYDQHEFLWKKIGFALKGPPQKESGYDNKTKAQIEQLYNVIKTESNEFAEFRDKVEISFIYNCLEPLPEEKVRRAKEFGDYNPKTDVNPVPIFVLRKCRGSDKPCRIFIDNTGRVYQNWQGYLTKNKLHKCEMIIPLNGRYEVENDIVLLEKHLSPACHLDTKLLQVGDIVSTGAGLAAGAVFIAAAIPAIPVAGPLLIGAGVAGVAAGVWAIGRSVHTLIDRKLHKESMSFANSEARGAYLNIVAGSLGFVGAGANVALTQLAKSGVNIGQGATYLVNTVGVLNIGAGGASLVNSGYEVFDQWYNDDQTPSALTILQLSTSVLFFGHAVYNFRPAQTIIDETQARVLKDYNDSLRSNRHRKTLNRLMKETFKSHGDGARGRAEVISAIRNIQNKDEVFAALTRNKKAMSRAGIRVAADGGQIRLSGIPIDMNEFIGLNKKQTETYLGSLSNQQLARQPMTTNISFSNFSTAFKTAVKDILSDIHVDTSGGKLNQLFTLTSKLLIFCSEDIRTKVLKAVHQVISNVFGILAEPIAKELDKIIPKNTQYFHYLNLGISYFSRKVDEWEQKYQRYEKTKDPEFFDPLFEKINPLYAKRIVAFFEFVVRNSYSGETLVRAVLTEITGYVTAWISRILFENEERKEHEERRLKHSAGFRARRVSCRDCGGYYFVHE